MKIPDNMTEDEVVAIIDNVAKRLARKFKFGYHDIEDMKQQARLYAWEGMENYDSTRPLENFLWTHVRNRLFNFKRDKYERPNKPCCECKQYIGGTCHIYDDLEECVSYKYWKTKNKSKKNLMNTIDISDINDTYEKNIREIYNLDDTLYYKEILEIIDKELPINLRPLFLRLKFGLRLTKAQKIKIQTTVKEILLQHGYSS
jgi:hypothetical protein